MSCTRASPIPLKSVLRGTSQNARRGNARFAKRSPPTFRYLRSEATSGQLHWRMTCKALFEMDNGRPVAQPRVVRRTREIIESTRRLVAEVEARNARAEDEQLVGKCYRQIETAREALRRLNDATRRLMKSK